MPGTLESVDVQLPLAAEESTNGRCGSSSGTRRCSTPAYGPRSGICSGCYRVVSDVLHECRPEDLADRFTATVDGLAIQILPASTEMRPDRMRSPPPRAFEPHLDLTDHPGAPG